MRFRKVARFGRNSVDAARPCQIIAEDRLTPDALHLPKTSNGRTTTRGPPPSAAAQQGHVGCVWMSFRLKPGSQAIPFDHEGNEFRGGAGCSAAISDRIASPISIACSACREPTASSRALSWRVKELAASSED